MNRRDIIKGFMAAPLVHLTPEAAKATQNKQTKIMVKTPRQGETLCSAANFPYVAFSAGGLDDY